MKTDRLSENCACTAYEGPEGSSEYFVLVRTGNNKFFEDSLGLAASHLDEVCRKYGLTKENLVFSRFFFSDIVNQKDQLTASGLFGQLAESACSFIEQPPLTGDDLVSLLYYIKGGAGIKKKKQNNGDIENTLTVSGDHYSLHFSCNLHAKEDLGPYNQTKHIFDTYGSRLARTGLVLRDNTVRTWLYLSDIDNHYEEVISARRDYFDISGLTKETHYIASTGVGATLSEKGMRISMDALSIENIKQEQITYLNAPEHLNPTHEYGVTFERGTRILFGDREHFYISGTASINKDGEVVHPGDVGRQTHRAVDNINALLSDHKADINDMAYLIVYLRNINHYGFVEEILRERTDSGPLLIFVNASICRASWLVEIEGAGIRSCSTDFPTFL